MTSEVIVREEESVVAAGRVDPHAEDGFWADRYWRESYFSPGLDYEDYAPAYCVGYIGHAQYGGSFDEAEKSLISNWVRIKGDSRLSLEQAMPAIRAAWDRMAKRHAPARKRSKRALATRLMRLRPRLPSPVGLSPSLAR